MSSVKLSMQGVTVHYFQTAPNFEIKDGDGHVVGNLRVSQGAIYWKPKKAKWIRVSYSDFDEIMKTMKKVHPVAEMSEPISDEADLSVQSHLQSTNTPFFARLFGQKKHFRT